MRSTNSPRARDHLFRIPRIVVGPSDAASMPDWSVVFHTATYGIDTPGTVYRMDGVPIPLRPAVASPFLGVEEILRKIEGRIRAITDSGKGGTGSDQVGSHPS